nr:PEPxxWA-CTERM sorting domain-containing protein [uncultured Sphingosinicella sp.]
MNTLFKVATGLALSCVAAAPATAAVVTLDFENIVPDGTQATEVRDFYNGGLSGSGRLGTDYGVFFSSNALAVCLNSLDVACTNASRGGLGNPSSQRGGLFFLQGVATIMDYEPGFSDGFSFNYSSTAYTGSIGVFEGFSGTGKLLATLTLSPNAGSCPGYNAQFCPFSAVGVSFTGTAHSIAFGGVANQIAFDDITFGSATPGGGAGAVPEPATWAMLLVGFGLIGGTMRRGRRTLAFA